MNSKLAQYLLGLILIVTGTCALSFILLPIQSFQPNDILYNQKNYQSWFSAINFSTNAYFPWRFDSFLNRFGFANTANSTLLLYVCLFGSGLYSFLFQKQRDAINAFALAFIGVLSIFLLFGLDVTIFGALAWLPWVVLALLYFYNAGKNQLLAGLLLFFLSLRLSSSAQYLAVLPALIAIAIGTPWRFIQKRFAVVATIILLAPAIYASCSIGEISFPDYPRLKSSLVPDDGLPGFQRPLIGPELPLPVINRDSVKHLYPPFALSLLIVGLFIVSKQKEPKDRSDLVLISFLVLCSVSLLDLIPREPMASIMPIAALSRIIPGLFLIPLVTIILVLAYFLFVVIICKYSERLVFKAWYLLLPVLVTSFWNSNSFPLPALASDNANSTYFAASDNNRQIVASPSYTLINSLGISILNKDWYQQKRRAVTPHHFGASITASTHNDKVELLADKTRTTRWSTGIGSQNGTEWILVYLPETKRIEGVSLQLGEFNSDFARGIAISYLDNCDENSKLSFDKYKEIFRSSPWLGSIQYSKSGYPYFGPQAWTRYIFPSAIDAKCFLISQVGTSSHYDWSVTELRFLVSTIKE